MRAVLSLLTYILLVPWVVLFVIVHTIIWLYSLLFDRKGRAMQWACRFWSSSLFVAVPGWKLKVEGAENLDPQRPCVVVINHRSMLDIPVMFKIIKIADMFFEDNELNKLALLAPEATVNVIRDFKVVEKKKVELPKEIFGIAKCRNPKCVTNHQPITTRFTVNVKGNETSLLCHYCEKISDTKKVF